MKNEFFLIFSAFFSLFPCFSNFLSSGKKKKTKGTFGGGLLRTWRGMEEEVDSLKVGYRAERDWGTKTEKDGRGEWARLKRT